MGRKHKKGGPLRPPVFEKIDMFLSRHLNAIQPRLRRTLVHFSGWQLFSIQFFSNASCFSPHPNSKGEGLEAQY